MTLLKSACLQFIGLTLLDVGCSHLSTLLLSVYITECWAVETWVRQGLEHNRFRPVKMLKAVTIKDLNLINNQMRYHWNYGTELFYFKDNLSELMCSHLVGQTEIQLNETWNYKLNIKEMLSHICCICNYKACTVVSLTPPEPKDIQCTMIWWGK